MTHTPGPWVVEPITNNDEAYGVYASAENAFVAVTPWGPSTEENATLIAAAPDMLAALEEMNALFADHAQYDEEGHETAAIKAAQAAIAKAKGE